MKSERNCAFTFLFAEKEEIIMETVNKEFFDACAKGDLEKVKETLANGADVNYKNGDSRTGLMRSAKRGYK